MRKILFSIFLFLFLTGTASAFSDDIERYVTDWTETYTIYKSGTVSAYDSTAVEIADPRLAINMGLKISTWTGTTYNNGYAYGCVVPIISSSPEYFSWVECSRGKSGSYATGATYIRITRPSDGALISSFVIDWTTYSTGAKLELIQNGGYYDLYINGNKVQSVVNSIPSYTGNVNFCPGVRVYKYTTGSSNAQQLAYVIIDDLTDSSMIGSNELYSEADTTFYISWNGQLLRSYPTSTHTISIYSLSNQANAGKVITYTIPNNDTAGGDEYGYITYSRDTIVDGYTGLYLLEMNRDSTILCNSFFYYDSLSNPQGFPETIFLGSSDVSADIRDFSNNGGLISPDGSVYLFADNGTDGFYPISFEIQNTPYHFEATISKVYSSESINETNISFSGLTNFYNVALDGSNIDTVDGSTFSYVITDWENYTEHIFSFTPDLTQPGIYGYVKDLSTKTGIHGAVITISNDSYSTNIATDETGYYYLAGLPASSIYTISAARSGYTASSDFTFTTSAGETSRKDIYLDPVNTGAGYYYAPHDVTFQVKQYWYSAPLPGVTYYVEDNNNTFKKSGSTDSKGSFTVAEMDQGTNYSINLTYQNTTYTKHIEPGLTEYTLILTEGGTLHTYVNNWLTLSYSETNGTVTINYISTKPVSEASLTITAGDGSNFYTGTSSNLTQSFSRDLSGGSDYNILFEIEATDGSSASQSWGYSAPGDVDLFPDSYPSWLKNTLFGGIIILFMLSFGKSKNDIACILAALLCSMGYFFGWLICSFNFVVLIWLIAAGAAVLHYKRTGHLG